MTKLRMSVSIPGKKKPKAMHKARFASKSEGKSYQEEQEEMHKRIKKDADAWNGWKKA